MVVNADHAVRAGEWSAYREAHSPQEIYEKTLLIIGFGRIGRDVAAKAQAFGMKVMAFDPFVTSKQMPRWASRRRTRWKWAFARPTMSRSSCTSRRKRAA